MAELPKDIENEKNSREKIQATNVQNQKQVDALQEAQESQVKSNKLIVADLESKITTLESFIAEY